MPVIGAPCHTKPRPFPRLAPRLTFGLRATIIVVADVSFRPCPPAAAPKEPVGRDHGGTRWTFTASTRKHAPRRSRQRATGTTPDGPPTRTTRNGAPTRSTKDGIAQKR